MPDEPAAGNDHAVTFPKIELHVHLEGTVRADASGELTGPGRPARFPAETTRG